MLSEKEVQKLLTRKQQEQKYLQYEKEHIAIRERREYELRIEIALLKIILEGEHK